MRQSIISVAFGLSMLSLSAAHAQGAQGYVGGGLGWANIGVDCTDVAACDKSGTGGKLYGGYRFANQFALEGVYINWGKAKGRITDDLVVPVGLAVPLDGSPIPVTADVDLKAAGLGIGMAYFMPVAKDWTGVVRLGVISNKGRLKLTASSNGSTVSESDSKRAAFADLGFGVGYNLSPNLALTGEADFSRVKYGSEGEHETDNVRLISLGLRYSF